MMSDLTKTQVAALRLLDRGGFVRTVAGWHQPDNCLNAFNGQTMMSLERRGLVRFKRRNPRHRAAAAFITEAGRAALRSAPRNCEPLPQRPFQLGAP
jgi:hypothetical protein